MYRQHRLREIGLRRGVSRDQNGLRRGLAWLNRTWTFDPCTPCLKFCTPTFKILPNSLRVTWGCWGFFRGSKNQQKSGKCHELPRKSVKKMLNPFFNPFVGGARGKLGNQLVYNKDYYAHVTHTCTVSNISCMFFICI